MDEQNDTPVDEPLFADVPDDLAAVSDDDLADLIADYEETRAAVTASPSSYVSASFTVADLLEATRQAVETTLPALKAEQARRAVEAAVEPTAEQTAAFEALASSETDEGDDGDDGDGDGEAAAEAVTAAAPTTRARLPRPPKGREIVEHEPAGPASPVTLVAAGGAHGILPGTPFESELDIARAMCDRHTQFGNSAPGTVEKFSIAQADWRDVYPDDRHLGKDEIVNLETIKPVIDQAAIKRALADRVRQVDRDVSLVASGGLCAPVTPYYNLQYISVPIRPVMGALPSFMADRGGLRYARPASLSAVTTGVGLITEAEDAAGGSSATKSCQVIPCPEFQETDVDIIYHCLQFGNLGARAFPELVAQWNNLVLAAHARLAESNLLTQIDAFSTQVTADALGLGASATLFSQVMAAANGIRSRNRTDPEAVLRLLIPWWAVDLIVSDVIRSQFQRFDTDRDAVTALFRSVGIEPTYYIDGANGRGQVFPTQPGSDDGLLPFPEDVVWYLYPEGSFLYLDGGMFELGIVRDSILNKTNDFQLFGETFESVAFVGVESIAVSTPVCDSGTVSLPAAVTCPISYGPS
jgi:hypothetical protein